MADGGRVQGEGSHLNHHSVVVVAVVVVVVVVVVATARVESPNGGRERRDTRVFRLGEAGRQVHAGTEYSVRPPVRFEFRDGAT